MPAGRDGGVESDRGLGNRDRRHADSHERADGLDLPCIGCCRRHFNDIRRQRLGRLRGEREETSARDEGFQPYDKALHPQIDETVDQLNSTVGAEAGCGIALFGRRHPECARLADEILGCVNLLLERAGRRGHVPAPFVLPMAWMNFQGSLAIRAPTSALHCARSATVRSPDVHLPARSACFAVMSWTHSATIFMAVDATVLVDCAGRALDCCPCPGSSLGSSSQSAQGMFGSGALAGPRTAFPSRRRHTP